MAPVTVRTPAQVQATPPPPSAAELERKQHIDRLAGPVKDPTTRRNVEEATRSFSNDQLKKMADTGVRIHVGDTVPKERYSAEVLNPGKRDHAGVYFPTSRTILLEKGAKTGEIRHELAHAWDDTKNEGKNGIKTRESDSAMVKRWKTDALYSKTAADDAATLRSKQRVAEAPMRQKLQKQIDAKEKEAAGYEPAYASSGKEVSDAYEKYLKKSGGDASKVFDSSASPGHSCQSQAEFYAEGYNTFHGKDEAAERGRLKMREHAPELYEMLKKEAKEQGLPTPYEPAKVELIKPGEPV